MTNQKPSPLYCVDCRHIRWTASGFFAPSRAQCGHPAALSLVSGRPRTDCEDARKSYMQMCGPKGEWFEPKDSSDD